MNANVANEKGWEYGTLDEVVPGALADRIAEKAGFGPDAGKTIKAFKVFRHVTPGDSISITRLGREEKMPAVWSTFVIDASLGENIQATVDSVGSLGQYLEFAQLNLYYPFLSDPLTNRQQSLFPTAQYPNADINVQEAWDLTYPIPQVKVGIVDQFVHYTHEDFNEGSTNGSSVIGGYDIVSDVNWIGLQTTPVYTNNHGTACAGIIGAIRNNNIGIAGIAGKDLNQTGTGCSLYSIGIANENGYGTFSEYIAPALYSGSVESGSSSVTYGCNVLNNSYGQNGQFSLDFAMREAIRTCYRNECVFVASNGNGGSAPHYPADFSLTYRDYSVLAVAGSGPDGSIMTVANGGVNLTAGGDLIAPGYQDMIMSTIRDGDIFPFSSDCVPAVSGPYSCFRGSSAAAPHATGVVALMQSTHHTAVGALNGLAPEDVEIIMEKAATDIGSAYGYPDGPDGFNGHGRLNAGESVRLVKAPYRVFHSGNPDTSVETIMPSQSVSIPGFSLSWAFTWGLPPGVYQMTQHVFELGYTNTFGPNTQILDGWGRTSSVFGNLDPHEDYEAAWDFTINGNTAYVQAVTSCWKVSNGPNGPMNIWIPVDPAKIKTPYSLHLYEEFKTSVPEVENGIFTLFPNPASSELRVTLNAIEARQLEVVDVTGRIVISRTIPKGRLILDLTIAHLAQGTYSLRLLGDQRTYSQRFIKH